MSMIHGTSKNNPALILRRGSTSVQCNHLLFKLCHWLEQYKLNLSYFGLLILLLPNPILKGFLVVQMLP